MLDTTDKTTMAASTVGPDGPSSASPALWANAAALVICRAGTRKMNAAVVIT